MWGPSHTFSDHNVQKLTMNSALQLYAVLRLLYDLRYSFRSSKASLYSPENVALQQVDFYVLQLAIKRRLQARKCGAVVRRSLACGTFLCVARPGLIG